MSHYNTLNKHSSLSPRYCCKYCIFATYEKDEIKKHSCKDKIDMIQFEISRKKVKV